jgi:oligopeptide transport system permease protein
MLAYAARRLMAATPILVCALVFAFLLLRFAPGGPFGGERYLSPGVEARLVADYGRDLPVGHQLAGYLGGLLRGDFGPSMVYEDKDVLDLLAEGAPASAVLGLSAVVMASLLGGLLGVGAALRPHRLASRVVAVAALTGLCLTSLLWAPLLQWLFGVALRATPLDGFYRDELRFSHLVLPVTALALPLAAYFATAMRASLAEALASSAMLAARARGVPAPLVLWTHALPLALLQILAGLGGVLASLLAGLVVVETVFQLPGIGRQVVLAAGARDYTLVAGAALACCLLLVLLNIAADLLRRRIDPRLRAP